MLFRPPLTKVVSKHYFTNRGKPEQGGSPDVAISPDVVSFVRDRFGYCGLRCDSGICDVAREISSISLAATGIVVGNVYSYRVPVAGFIDAVRVGRV